MTTIKLKNGSGAPTAGDLVQGEPALDLTNKRLYTEDSGGTVIEVGTNPGTDVTFADNRKAIFGAGSDLQIYHTGSHSYVDDTGTGNLYLNSNGSGTIITGASETQAQFFTNGAVNLFYDNAQKLATTSTGINVTGTVDMDGFTSVGNGTITGDLLVQEGSGFPRITLKDTDGTNTQAFINHSGSDLTLTTQNGTSNGRLIFARFDGTTTTTSGYFDANGKLFLNGALDVTGTVTADGLTVGATSAPTISIEDSDGGFTASSFSATNGGRDLTIKAPQEVVIQDADTGNKWLRIDEGDISFYEDTGTTAKLFWDASAESLGIGTSSPRTLLHVTGLTGDDDPALGSSTAPVFISNTANSYGLNIGVNNAGAGWLQAQSNTASTSYNLLLNPLGGNVGIGTSSPSNDLQVGDATDATEIINIASTGNGYLTFGDAADNDIGFLQYNHASNFMAFATNTAEAMRIDSSGNVLVATTDTLIQTATSGGGLCYAADSSLRIARESNGSDQPTLDLNNTGSDDEIIRLRKDGSSIGKIAVSGGNNLSIGGTVADHSGLLFGTHVVFPTEAGSLANGTISLGDLSFRFDDIYATNGTIQTSDRNEKQDIEALSDAEQRVAVACKGLLRKFRWKSSVAENGDDARIHFGIIAQDLQAAFEAEGLDAGRYAMFISTTWTDEETGEERTRMGVRYSELLAFIIAAI